MKWQVKGEKRGLVVGLTAPTGPVRVLVRSRPWAGPCPSVDAWAQKFDVHGHIADGNAGQGAVCVDAAWPDLARVWPAGANRAGAFRIDVRG